MNLYRKLFLAFLISGVGMLAYAVLGSASSMHGSVFADDDEPTQESNSNEDNLSEEYLYGVKPMEVITYEDLKTEYPMDIANPSNVNSVVEYVGDTGNYI